MRIWWVRVEPEIERERDISCGYISELWDRVALQLNLCMYIYIYFYLSIYIYIYIYIQSIEHAVPSVGECVGSEENGDFCSSITTQPNMRQAVLLVCALLAVLADGAVGRAILADGAVGSRRPPRHNFGVKTIKSEDGDIIDCVDVYRQPSLERLSLQNRTIQIFQNQPSSTSNLDPSKILRQRWQKSGSCPQGTIPIRRRTNVGAGKDEMSLPCADGCSGSVERALAYCSPGGPFHGASAYMQVWGVNVRPNEYSMSHVTLLSATNKETSLFRDLNVTDLVRAGWAVYPKLFGDNLTRFFIQWSNDNGVHTGCFNLDCEGFVQTNANIVIGGSLEPLSVYDDSLQQAFMRVNIYKHSSLHRWYLDINEMEVGFWLMDYLFQDFSEAPWVTWGGQILDTWPEAQHTTTQMGSGHPAKEGRTRAAMMYDLTVKRRDDLLYHYRPGFFQSLPTCYDAKYLGSDPGPTFTFGGSGGPNCLQ